MAGLQLELFEAVRGPGGFARARSGTNFRPESGKLYRLEPGRITVMTGWPAPRAWRKTKKSRTWHHCRPEIRLPSGPLHERIQQASLPAAPAADHPIPEFTPAQIAGFRLAALAHLRWYDTIPVPVRDALAPFESRQWHLLSLVARCGDPALDLVHANPTLAYALASSWVFRRAPVARPLRSERALLAPGKKQRDILAWLGFPAGEPARRLLHKVIHAAIDIAPLLYLRQGMADADVHRALGRLPRVNVVAIRIATDPELQPHARQTLLDEVSRAGDEDGHPAAAFLLRDSLGMHALVFPARRFTPVARLATLQRLHDSLVEELNRSQRTIGTLPFPPPPVPGTAHIEPIVDAQELLAEGRAQNNCVASYVARIAVERRTYVYRVVAPERCTLSLVQVAGRWVPGELRRAGNLPASESTRRAVAEWLASRADRGAA